MASRTSDMISQKYYLGSRRGRPIMDNMAWEMFPGKIEATQLIEDQPFDMLNSDRRDTLRDFSPEQNSLFPYEQPRRDTYSKSHINLREGVFGSTTDPWANSGQNGGDGFDISFHDKDPRGWSTEQNWREFRRLVTESLQNTDFKDDGDYSETSGHIHQGDLNRKIRASQDWAKNRLKIFSEEYESKSNGGVGIYPQTSKVYRSDYEDTTAAENGVAPSQYFDDDTMRPQHNVNISNLVHLGGRHFRPDSTTDHLVKVSGYGKLYKQRGLLNHETGLRITEDDTIFRSSSAQNNKNLVKLMASQIYSDNPNISPYTSAEIARILQQTDKVEQLKPNLTRDELESTNRSMKLTVDIMNLLGITENDIKFLESSKNVNRKTADQQLAQIKNMVTTVHKLPMNAKLDVKNELILLSSSKGLVPGEDIQKNRGSTVINPKFIDFMAFQTGKTPGYGDVFANRDQAYVDPEDKLKNFVNQANMYIYKTANKPNDEISARWDAKFDQLSVDTSKKHMVYKNLDKIRKRMERNRNSINNDQTFNISARTVDYQKSLIGDFIPDVNRRDIMLDNIFGENRFLDRHGGRMGQKSNSRYNTASSHADIDEMNERLTEHMKNAKNIK